MLKLLKKGELIKPDAKRSSNNESSSHVSEGGEAVYNEASSHLDKKYGKFDGLGFHWRAWCADFVSWCASNAGQSDAIPWNSSVSGLRSAIKDAGGNYPWADDKNTGSLTLDFNQVLVKAQNADVWLLKSPAIHSLADLKASYSLNEKFKAYQTGNVYVCDTNTTHFFDRFPFHPEVLLQEYFKIFHPEVATDYQLQFFKKVG